MTEVQESGSIGWVQIENSLRRIPFFLSPHKHQYRAIEYRWLLASVKSHNGAVMGAAVIRYCPIKPAASLSISFVQAWPTPSCTNTFFTPSGPTSNPSTKVSLTLQGTKGSSFPDKTNIFFPRKALEGLSDLRSLEARSDILMRDINEFGIWGAWNGISLVCALYLISSR